MWTPDEKEIEEALVKWTTQPLTFGETKEMAIAQATLRHVYEELQKYQRTTREPGLIFYIPTKDWAKLKKEAGL